MSGGEINNFMESCIRTKYQHNFNQNKQYMQLLKEQILSLYQELQASTIRLEELDNILEIWEDVTDDSLKKFAKFIREFYCKFKKQIELQKEYNCLVAVNEATQLVLLQNGASTTDTQIVESIMSQCPACEELIVYADKHNIKNIVQDSILKCIQEKVRGKKYIQIIKQLQDFVATYCKPLVHRKTKQLLDKFESNLSSQTTVLKRAENQEVKNSKEKLMNIKIDLQILNSQILEDIESLMQFDKNGEYSNKICETLSNYISLIENNQIEKLIIEMIQGLSFIFTDKFQMESSELFHYISHQKSQLDLQELPTKIHSTHSSHKNQALINNYREYCENLYDTYLLNLKQDENEEDLGQYLQERTENRNDQKMVFLKKLERQIIGVVWEYVDSLEKKENVEGVIGRIQEKIGNLEGEKQEKEETKNYDLPLQIKNHYSNRSNSQKNKNGSTANYLVLNDENQLMESFKVRKQMHISTTTVNNKGVPKVRKYEEMKKNSQERFLQFSKKALIFIKTESNFSEQVEIKRVLKIVKTTPNQLVFFFQKGYMAVQFLHNQNSTPDTLLKEFLAIFINKYGEVYPDIIFENKSRVFHTFQSYNCQKPVSYQKPAFQMYSQSYYQ